ARAWGVGGRAWGGCREVVGRGRGRVGGLAGGVYGGAGGVGGVGDVVGGVGGVGCVGGGIGGVVGGVGGGAGVVVGGGGGVVGVGGVVGGRGGVGVDGAFLRGSVRPCHRGAHCGGVLVVPLRGHQVNDPTSAPRRQPHGQNPPVQFGFSRVGGTEQPPDQRHQQVPFTVREVVVHYPRSRRQHWMCAHGRVREVLASEQRDILHDARALGRIVVCPCGQHRHEIGNGHFAASRSDDCPTHSATPSPRQSGQTSTHRAELPA